ncbi:MAG: MmgE/PrpD family protein [Deltaproteobacteria bacterium]|nr:MmgE/PrpD family protein [Deltaproteobacteria bacterium]
METLAFKLASWATKLKLNDIPATVVDVAKRCIIDVVGVSIAGSQFHVSDTARKIAFHEYPAGSCTVIGTTNKLSALGASFCNAVAAHCLDFDDTCYDGIVHGSAAVWPSVLAVGEMVEASGKEVLTAFIAGVETEYTLGRFFTNHLYMKGWWNSSVLGVIGAAVGAAKLQDFNETQSMNTIQNAACFSFGPRALLGTYLKPTAMGITSSTGIFSTLLARQGLTGPSDIFENPRGMINLFNDNVKNEKSLDYLGKSYSLENPGIAFKLYPVCSAAQAAAEALNEILTDYNLKRSDISKVICEVPPLVAASLIYPNPANVTQAQFSMQFALGCILAYGQLRVAQLCEDVLNDTVLKKEMQKVEMIKNDALSASEHDRKNYPEGAIVTVITGSGEEIRVFNGAATGMPIKPMSDGQLNNKFISFAETQLTSEHSWKLLKRLRSIETVASINDLFGSNDTT